MLTLSASFPIFSIVLRENIKNLFLSDRNAKHGIFVDKILFSSVSIVPPLIVAYLTHDVGELVKVGLKAKLIFYVSGFQRFN